MTDPIDSYVDRAIAWATARLGNPDYAFRCLAFVEDAYEAGNAIEIFGGSTAKESADEYGVTEPQPTAVPRGAFVFYDMTGELFGRRTNWGHVGLHFGDGRVVHAWDEVRIDGYLALQALEVAPGWTQPRYIGWAAPERLLRGHRIK